MSNFRTLDQAIHFYEVAQSIRVSGELRDQLHRAASSIALNLSEGNAKASANDKKAFFQRSYGSLRECQTILKLLKVEDKEVHSAADKLAASLYKLINSEIKNSPNWRT
jgi:four helix bundle protein